MVSIPAGQQVYVVDVTYIVGLRDLAPHLKDHESFVQDGMRQGRFLTAGPKTLDRGITIIVMAPTKEAALEMMVDHPWYRHELATFEVKSPIEQAQTPSPV